jgi:hypothetical protein
MNSPTKQISLNILALTVFLLMISSLVGPLVQVSPLIPSLLVFGLLVGTSLDNFFLQSRVAGLVLDTIARRDPEYVDRIIYHEAGHFLLAQIWGISVTGYSLSAWEAWQQGQVGQGGVAFAPPPSQISGQLLDRYCMLWMAGVAAEQLIYSNSQGGSDDRQKLRGMLSLAGCTASGLARAENAALVQAKHQLETHRSSFDALVLALRAGQPVTDCCALIALDLAQTAPQLYD